MSKTKTERATGSARKNLITRLKKSKAALKKELGVGQMSGVILQNQVAIMELLLEK